MKVIVLGLFVSTICTILSCQPSDAKKVKEASFVQLNEHRQQEQNKSGKILSTRFNTPKGYIRENLPEYSYAYYLRHIGLKPHGVKVKYFDGSLKPPHGVYTAVVDYDLGKRDLQQCADAVMRLRAEYLYQQKQYQQIHFKLTNGMQVDYQKWAEGNRIKVSGNKTYWFSGAEKDYSYKSFQKYLDLIYAYAGSASLSKELEPVDFSDLQIGDVFIQGGFPGHAITVMDIAVNLKDTTDKLFIISQSYMPAQDIQILLNPNHNEETVWYSSKSVEKTGQLVTPEWLFYISDLKRFK